MILSFKEILFAILNQKKNLKINCIIPIKIKRFPKSTKNNFISQRKEFAFHSIY